MIMDKERAVLFFLEDNVKTNIMDIKCTRLKYKVHWMKDQIEYLSHKEKRKAKLLLCFGMENPLNGRD